MWVCFWQDATKDQVFFLVYKFSIVSSLICLQKTITILKMCAKSECYKVNIKKKLFTKKDIQS